MSGGQLVWSDPRYDDGRHCSVALEVHLLLLVVHRTSCMHGGILGSQHAIQQIQVATDLSSSPRMLPLRMSQVLK